MAALLIVAAARVGPELTEALTNRITWMFTRLAADRASITALNILRRVSADRDRVDAHRSPLGRRITAVCRRRVGLADCLGSLSLAPKEWCNDCDQSERTRKKADCSSHAIPGTPTPNSRPTRQMRHAPIWTPALMSCCGRAGPRHGAAILPLAPTRRAAVLPRR
jgi:hypothetical protein